MIQIILRIIGVVVIVGIVLYIVLMTKNSKTPENLGVHNGKLAPMPTSPNAISSQTDVEEKYVEPFQFKGDLESTKEKILSILKAQKNARIIKNESNYIYAVFTTEKMKYNDDVEFYFDNDAKIVHFRSASRVGYSDMGLNKERYNVIKKAYIDLQ